MNHSFEAEHRFLRVPKPKILFLGTEFEGKLQISHRKFNYIKALFTERFTVDLWEDVKIFQVVIYSVNHCAHGTKIKTNMCAVYKLDRLLYCVAAAGPPGRLWRSPELLCGRSLEGSRYCQLRSLRQLQPSAKAHRLHQSVFLHRLDLLCKRPSPLL